MNRKRSSGRRRRKEKRGKQKRNGEKRRHRNASCLSLISCLSLSSSIFFLRCSSLSSWSSFFLQYSRFLLVFIIYFVVSSFPSHLVVLLSSPPTGRVRRLCIIEEGFFFLVSFQTSSELESCCDFRIRVDRTAFFIRPPPPA
jgi:hypothetical protein